MGEEELRHPNMVSSSTGGGGGGFCYSDVSSSSNPTIQNHHQHLVNQIQGFGSNPAEIFNLTASMEMIGFSKNHPQQQQQDGTNSIMWKGFFNKTGGGGSGGGGDGGDGVGPSSSKAMNESTSTDHFYNQEFHTTGISETSNENIMVGGPSPHDHTSAAAGTVTTATNWQEQQHRLLVDDSSLRCVFPCEGNERPSQGLSLSLSSANPSSIGLQSFELRHTPQNQDSNSSPVQEEMRFINPTSSRDGFFFGKSAAAGGGTSMMQDGYLTKLGNLQHFQLRNSRYLRPAQELLNEFCSLGTKETENLKQKPPQNSCNKNQWDQDENNGTSSSNSSRKNQALYSLELMDLQKRKTKLLSMLEELDRRYRHYCSQMKAVVSSFEAAAGNGAATVYSALASKAMSRHFRCLRDGIVSQIHATKKAMGEKDPVAPGTSKGETPRLRVLDQTLRQQRAFQQMNMMETHPWRPQRGLPERSVSVLRGWLFEHFLHPYPSDVDKHILARQTGLSRSQVSNWFINARVRLWKPMVEDMYLEELKEREMVAAAAASSDGVINDLDDNINIGRPSNQIVNPSSTDQKPTQDQLVRIDSECLSSIITSNVQDKNDHMITPKSTTTKSAFHHHHQNLQSFGSYGAMELDFSAYNHQTAAGAVSYANDHSSNQNFNGGGVSLTLGLQQHGGSGVSLAFSPASQSSLFYSRDQMEDCQPVQYSLLDGEGQNLPYRNLMGAQLLHDLAG